MVFKRSLFLPINYLLIPLIILVSSIYAKAENSDKKPKETTISGQEEINPAVGQKKEETQKDGQASKESKELKKPVVLMETSMGNIKIELLEKEAPLTVKNFLDYVKEKFYDGTIFHRVVTNFVIQGGGFTSEMKQKPTKSPIRNEATNKISNTTGTVAMARTSVVDSATSQFFINLKDNLFLDHTNETMQGYGYCVFGKVIEGMEVVSQIGKVQTTTKDYVPDIPVTPVVIKSVTLVP